MMLMFLSRLKLNPCSNKFYQNVPMFANNSQYSRSTTRLISIHAPSCGSLNGVSPIKVSVSSSTKNLYSYCSKICNYNNSNPKPHFQLIARTLKSAASANLGDPLVGNRFRSMDGIPPKYELIYRTSLPNYLLGVQCVNFFLYIMGGLIIFNKVFGENDEETTPESKEAKREKIVAEIDDKERSFKSYILDPDHKSSSLPKARFEEAVFDTEDNPWLLGAFGLTALSLLIGFVRLLNRTPVRLYVGPKGHSVGIYYGHILPFKKTKKEFIAGTLRRSTKNTMFTHSLFSDPQGRGIILLEHCFRYPNDLKGLLHPSVAKLESSTQENLKKLHQ